MMVCIALSFFFLCVCVSPLTPENVVGSLYEEFITLSWFHVSSLFCLYPE